MASIRSNFGGYFCFDTCPTGTYRKENLCLMKDPCMKGIYNVTRNKADCVVCIATNNGDEYLI